MNLDKLDKMMPFIRKKKAGEAVDVVLEFWHLSSRDEIDAMYTNLHAEGVGGFTDTYYWCSSEIDADLAYIYTFLDGFSELSTKAASGRVRACRAFTAGAGVYKLRDVGPGGGLVFYVNGTDYIEAAAADQSTGKYWSNIQNVLIGTTGTAIGTGRANTLAIIGQAGHTDSAARLCDDLNIFESTWKTDNVGTSSDVQISLPLVAGGTYAFNVDWGDSSSDWITVYNQVETTHTYSIAGTYTVKITGICKGWSFNNGLDKLKLLTAESWGRLLFVNYGGYFYGCTNMVVNAVDSIRIDSSITVLTNAFYGCSSMEALNVRDWDVSAVTLFNYAFYGCTALVTLNTSKWNTSVATNFFACFRSCTNLASLDVSGWGVGLVTNFGDMFQDCAAIDNLDVSSWDVSSGQYFEYMFKSCTSLSALDVSSWNTGAALTFEYTFGFDALITTLGVNNWNITLVTNMTYMFRLMTLTTANYDAILIAWEAQAVQNNVTVDFGSSKYTAGGAAAAARQALIDDHTWAITDGGTA